MTRKTSYHTCNLCEAMCGLAIETDNEQILSIKGDKQDSFSRGYICPKATALQDIYEDPERLTKPLERTEHGWTTIAWEEAFDKVAANLKRIQTQYGQNSVGTYLGNPNVHNMGALLFGRELLQTLNTKNMYSATSVDQLPHHLVASKLFGHMLKMPVPDIDRTDFFLMLGANPVASNGSIMTSPDIKNRIKAIQKRGGKIIVIDPRKTETAEMANKHHFIKPGTDALLLLAMIHVIFESNIIDDRCNHLLSNELDALREDVIPYSPERVADKVGMDSVEIRRLTYAFSEAKKPVCYGRMGASVQSFGTLSQYLIMVFNLLNGRVDTEGGMMFTQPAADLLSHTSKGHFDRYRSRVRNLPEFNGEFPVATLADEILTPGKDQIKAMIFAAGNPVISTPNGNKLDKALQELDFVVSIDFYLNETNRHANIILPPVSQLERDHYDLIFNLLSVRNTAKFSPALFSAPNNAKQDWEIYLSLTDRLKSKKSLRDKLIHRFHKKYGPTAQLDLLLRTGPYGKLLNPFSGLTLKALKSNPHGIDLGPLKPQLPNGLRTKNKQIELSRDFFMKDLTRLENTFFKQPQADKEDKANFTLIGRRHIRSNNSWMHNSRRLVKGKSRCTVMMHSSDCHALKLKDGETVEITSSVGSITLPIEITDQIAKGVISIPHGWGHNKKGTRWSTAEKYAGANANDLTDDNMIDQFCGTAVLNGLTVKVCPKTKPNTSQQKHREAAEPEAQEA
ncbi:molybdopterin-dependent oxidoreductase [Litoribacillus peritrichatus]|uniref:Molybdopterin oxidoreductase family protein n=1 Tax=Litoribacillus peritrichatus TaxID=718191 RepID=A0ABP7MEY4_9GAMM